MGVENLAEVTRRARLNRVICETVEHNALYHKLAAGYVPRRPSLRERLRSWLCAKLGCDSG